MSERKRAKYIERRKREEKESEMIP